MNEDDTYPMPEHGWRCFHCGEHFPGTQAGMRAATKHFSKVPTLPPECLDSASPARRLARRARIAERFAEDARQERDRAIEDAEIAQGEVALFRRLTKCASANDLRNQQDFDEGRLLVAEGTLALIEARFPTLVERARRALEKQVPL